MDTHALITQLRDAIRAADTHPDRQAGVDAATRLDLAAYDTIVQVIFDPSLDLADATASAEEGEWTPLVGATPETLDEMALATLGAGDYEWKSEGDIFHVRRVAE